MTPTTQKPLTSRRLSGIDSPWTEQTLREVGGTEGVGVTFLEETFSVKTAPRRIARINPRCGPF